MHTVLGREKQLYAGPLQGQDSETIREGTAALQETRGRILAKDWVDDHYLFGWSGYLTGLSMRKVYEVYSLIRCTAGS